MGSGRHQLRFLHVSDLHLRGSQEKEAWRRRRVLGDSWKRNLETLLNEEGTVDFVFFTGDAVQSGKADEFEEATIFFTELCRELDLDLSRLFVIPGNHDIDRTIEANVWESMRMSLAASPDLLAVSRWMNDIASHPPLGFQASWRTSILERQQPYCRWVREYLKRSELAPGGLGYRSTVQLPGWTHPIHIAGLDTSWLCGDNADSGRLLLTENQVGRHLTTDSGQPLPGLRIVLMHHPLHDLADASAVKRLLAQNADIVLRGHLHETEVAEWLDPDSRLRELAAGSLYEGGRADKYGNSCHFIRFELDSDLRPIEALVRFRSFSPRGGHWFDDNSLYTETRNGRITWAFRSTTPKRPNPYSPWTPRPEHCFGRGDVFRLLESAFDERRSVWIVGDWRIGKTTVLLAWEKRLRERGVTAKFISGQGSAGISVADFVKTVTGLSLESSTDPDAAADRLITWIEAVSRSGIPPVVLVDEVEAVVQTCDVRFFDRLRDLLGRVCRVFASREAPDEVFARSNKTSPITNRMQPAWIGLLEAGGEAEIVRHGGEHLGPGDADLMRRWCGRHSFYLQLCGWILAEARHSGKGQDEALADLQSQAVIHFRLLWQTVPQKHRQALSDAARGVPCQIGVLRQRGLVKEDGLPFGELFGAWLRGEMG